MSVFSHFDNNDQTEANRGAFILPNRDGLTSFMEVVSERALVPYVPPIWESVPEMIKDFNKEPGTVIAFDKKNYLSTLDLAFPDPYMRVLLAHAFNKAVLMKPLDVKNTISTPLNSGTLYSFDPDFAELIWAELRTLAQMVLMSTKLESIDHIPTFYSRDFENVKWIHSGFSQFLCHLVFGHGENELRNVVVETYDGLQKIYTLLQFLTRRYAIWILKQVCASISKGYLSESNWGGFFGLTQDETLTRLTRKSVHRLGAEKSLKELRAERKAQGMKEELVVEEGKELVLHPIQSSHGILTPYSPFDPEFDIDLCVPSADVTMEEQDFGDLMVITSQEYRDDIF
jgi:hypothetical protein